MGRNIEPTPDIVNQIKALERRISNLETTRRITNTAIDAGEFSVKAGAFVVYDNANNERVRMGLLDDSTYGIQVINEINQSLSLTKVAGLQAAKQDSSMTVNVGTGDYIPAPDGLGPVVSAYIGPSQRCLVIISAKMGGSTGGADSYIGMALRVTRVDTGAETLGASDLRNLFYSHPNVGLNIFTVSRSRVDLYEGSTIFPVAGLYRFEAYYVSRVNAGVIQDRAIAILPF